MVRTTQGKPNVPLIKYHLSKYVFYRTIPLYVQICLLQCYNNIKKKWNHIYQQNNKDLWYIMLWTIMEYHNGGVYIFAYLPRMVIIQGYTNKCPRRHRKINVWYHPTHIAIVLIKLK